MRALLLMTLTGLISTPAVAGPQVSGFLQTTTAQDGAPELGNGGGVRLGMTANLLLVRLTPEVGLGMYEEGILAPHVGAQLRVGKLIEPGAYAHYWFNAIPGAQDYEHGFDAGLALDFTAIPKINIGAQVGIIDLQSSTGNHRYHTLGGHISYAF